MVGEPSISTGMLTGIASILRAIAWPGIVIFFFLIYRTKLTEIFDVLIQKLKDAKHLKAGQVEIDTEQAMDTVIEKSGEGAKSQGVLKEIPKEQVQAAQKVGEELNAAPITFSHKLDVAHKQIYKLINQYEQTRHTLPSGSKRTNAMNEIAAKMRALAIAAYPLLPLLMAGEKPGERLAAVCILQIRPELGYFDWLIERVMNEEQPFLFFHASLAILETVKAHPYFRREIARESIHSAIERIGSFQNGQPDQNTIDVLNQALSLLSR